MTKTELLEKINKIGIENASIIITVVELPTKAKETIINYRELPGKIDYLLEAYDDNLVLKKCSDIRLLDCIIL